MKKIKNIIFLSLIVSCVIWLIYCLFKDKECVGNNYFNDIKFYGTVKAKYLDHEQHSVPVIELIDLNQKMVRKIGFFNENNNSYEKIKINDIIIKEKGSMNIYVIKNGKKDFLTKVNFNCR